MTESAGRNWGLLLLILLLAFGLRVWGLEAAPPGVTHDEAAHLHDAQRIWEGARPIYLTTAYGREPLYDYVAAPLVGLLGRQVGVGRLISALWGTALVALVYGWARRAFDRPVGLLAAALLAVSFWPLATSRQILRSISMPVMLTAGMLFFWGALFPRGRGKGRRDLVLAGLFLGLSFYTYMPARTSWLIPALLGLSLALTDRPRWRGIRWGLGAMLLVMALVAAPLLGYLAAHPALEVRVDELAEPLRSALVGDPGPLWQRFQQTVGLFSHQGDVQWIYNIAGRPLLPPVLALLFYLGILVAARESLKSGRLAQAHRVLLLWLVLGVVPALVTGLESSSLRAIAAQPAVFVLTALPLAAAGKGLMRWAIRAGREAMARWGLLALALLGLALLAAQTVGDYFGNWAKDPATRVAYHSHMVAMIRHLEGTPDLSPVGVSSIYPGPLHDQYTAAVVTERAELLDGLRWYDARSALVFPQAEEARAIFPALARLDPALAAYFEPAASLVERVNLHADDLSPWFELYRWQPQAARSRLPLAEPVVVGEWLAFRGYDLLTPTVTAGGTVGLVTFWEPLLERPAGEELVLFTHLLDQDRVVGQQDRLDVPPSAWRRGDLFAQYHRFSVEAGLSAGFYDLEVGAYFRAADNPRLPIYRDGKMVGDRILLEAVELTGSGY